MIELEAMEWCEKYAMLYGRKLSVSVNFYNPTRVKMERSEGGSDGSYVWSIVDDSILEWSFTSLLNSVLEKDGVSEEEMHIRCSAYGIDNRNESMCHWMRLYGDDWKHASYVFAKNEAEIAYYAKIWAEKVERSDIFKRMLGYEKDKMMIAKWKNEL